MEDYNYNLMQRDSHQANGTRVMTKSHCPRPPTQTMKVLMIATNCMFKNKEQNNRI